MANLNPKTELINVSNLIDIIIERESDDRKFLSSNMLASLRTLTEDVALLTYNKINNLYLDAHYENKKIALNSITGLVKLRSVNKLYKYLEASASHYTPDGINSERLILKYFLLLIDIKKYVKEEFNIEILRKIYNYPLNTDRTFIDYYDKVAEKIDQVGLYENNNYIKGRYYIERIKPFKSKNKLYYEVTLTKAIDYQSKFDRIIAFTQYRILENYSIKVSFVDAKIDVFNGNVSIKIIDNWKVNIRPCEIYNFAKVFGENYKITSKYYEYETLMNYLTVNQIDLLDIVLSNNDDFESTIFAIRNSNKEGRISDLLRNIRNIVINEKYGHNTIRYLSYIMSNRVIKSQLQNLANPKMNNSFLQNGCMMFEDMPFYMSLLTHNPDIDDLLMTINSKNREEEFLARYIKNNTEYNNKLYTPIQEVKHFNSINELVEKLEDRIYFTAKNSKLILADSYIYIKEYEDKTLYVLKKLFNLTNSRIDRYSEDIDFTLLLSPNLIFEDNKEIMQKLFADSCTAIVYGSAGTGKTTFIGDYCKICDKEKIILLANTHSAVENMKRKVECDGDFVFKVVKQYLAKKNENYDCDTLIIDESSTVSNDDMYEILNRTKFKKILIVGDTCQIGSIPYGNWFNLACEILPDFSKHYLSNTRRTTNENLLEFWSKVRDGDEQITEFLAKTDINNDIGNSMIDNFDNDEVMLCLNYNGLYGINNINKYIQDKNNSKGVEIGINTYKINDPIIFEDNSMYKNTLYNNLKGKIIDIEEIDALVIFTIEIEDKIDRYFAKYEGIEIIEECDNGHSIIKLSVINFDDSDEDDNGINNDIVPFNVSYAISIHKAQGLEYNSVKIVISNDVQDLITKDIFYTAITRAKNNLHIYWSSETQNYIIKNINNKELNIDTKIVRSKLKI